MKEKITSPVDLDVAAMSLDQALVLSRQLAEKIHSAGHFSAPNLNHHIGAHNVLVVGHHAGASEFTSTTTPIMQYLGTSQHGLPNRTVQTFVVDGLVPPSMSGQMPKIDILGQPSLDKTEIALAALQQALSTPHAAYEAPQPKQTSSTDVDEGTEADWQAVKEAVLDLLKAQLIDTPDTHLAFIRSRIQPILDHHVEP